MAGFTHNRHGGRKFTDPCADASKRQLLRGIRQLRQLADAGTIALALMWLFIAAVSSMDVYCSIKYEVELLAEEMNPIGRWLMELDGGSVSLFMACKFFCNLLAVSGLHALYAVHRPLCLVAAGVMSLAQGCLAVVLWV